MMLERALNMDDVGPALYQLFVEIAIINQLGQKAMERALPKGLSFAGFGVLSHFVRLGRPENPSHLAAAFQVTKGAMTNTIRRLEDQGYVEVLPDPADARAKLIAITDKGEDVHFAAIRCVQPVLNSIAGQTDVKRLIDMLPLLRELRVAMDEARTPIDFPELASQYDG